MSLTATLFAFASGLAARLPKPKDHSNADVEITKLKTELAHARLQIDVMRLALMEARRENVRREIIPLGGQQLLGAQAYQRQPAAQQALAQQRARYTQNFQPQAYQQPALAQQAQQLAQQADNLAWRRAAQTFEGFCNCVPSRGQVWGAMAQQQRLDE